MSRFVKLCLVIVTAAWTLVPAAHANWDDLWMATWNMGGGGGDKWKFVKKNLVHAPHDVVFLTETGGVPTGVDTNNILNIFVLDDDVTDPTQSSSRYLTSVLASFRNGRTWQQLVAGQNNSYSYTYNGSTYTQAKHNAVYEFEWDCGARDVDPSTGQRHRHYLYYFPTHGSAGYAYNRGTNMAIVTNVRAQWAHMVNRRMVSADPSSGNLANRGLFLVRLPVTDLLALRGETPNNPNGTDDAHNFAVAHAGAGQSNSRGNNADRILTALGERSANDPGGRETVAAGDWNRDGLNDDPDYTALDSRYNGQNVIPRDNNFNSRFADYRPTGPTRFGRDGSARRFTQLDYFFATGGRIPSFGARQGPASLSSDHQPVSACRNYGLKRTRISPKGTVNSSTKKRCMVSENKGAGGEPASGSVESEVCTRSPHQEWSFAPNGSLRLGDLCLRQVLGYRPELTTCDASAANQKWEILHSRTVTQIRNKDTGRCLSTENFESGAYDGDLFTRTCSTTNKYQDFLLATGEGQVVSQTAATTFRCLGRNNADAQAKTCADFPFSSGSGGESWDMVWQHGLDGSIQRYGNCLQAKSSDDTVGVAACQNANLYQQWHKTSGGEALANIGKSTTDTSDIVGKFYCLDEWQDYSMWSCWADDAAIESGTLRYSSQRFYIGQEFGFLESGDDTDQCMDRSNDGLDIEFTTCSSDARHSWQHNFNRTVFNSSSCIEYNEEVGDADLGQCSHDAPLQEWNYTYKGILINEEAEFWIQGPGGESQLFWE